MASKAVQPTFPFNLQMANRLKPARVFKTALEPVPPPPPSAQSGRSQPNTRRHITGISFDDHGDTLVTAGEDETFRLYSCKTGKHLKTLYSKKYGVDLPKFTHKNSTIIYASTKEDDTIRYHSLHDNKYLRVVSLEVSPIDDGFMSGSEDHTVRLWDLRTTTARGELNLPATPIVAYDSNGVVFAVGINLYQRINLYDTKNFDKEPFLHIILDDVSLAKISYPPRFPVMTSLSFSSNGKMLLVGTAGDAHYVLDAFEGTLLYKLAGFVGLERGKSSGPNSLGMVPSRGISGEEVCWTPDSKFVVGGSQDGRVYLWDLSEPAKLPKPAPRGVDPVVLAPSVTLDGHPGPSRCVKFNPRFIMLATAGAELAFWQPDITEKGKGPETS
ncbi:hypothetical protein BS47DRAFT_1339037 [Hydnum rufescens UP504]|uniref:WD40 repeat-like protein n=1 Tax=Hydnum rufescens UP504 TaxID=1448309 RepID=A0A9P6B7P4_9AGAM|nr:hypothetical protein BS47DRAFT_1339037 [Hydnum rufescens UP504]